MTTALTPGQQELRDALDALDDLSGHLGRYTDPAKLAAHLRSHAHDYTIHAAWEENLPALTGAHKLTHAPEVRNAHIRADDAEDALGSQIAAAVKGGR